MIDFHEIVDFRCSNMQSYQKLSTKILVPFALTYLCVSVLYSPLHLKNKYRNRLNSSNDLRVALQLLRAKV